MHCVLDVNILRTVLSYATPSERRRLRRTGRLWNAAVTEWFTFGGLKRIPGCLARRVCSPYPTSAQQFVDTFGQGGHFLGVRCCMARPDEAAAAALAATTAPPAKRSRRSKREQQQQPAEEDGVCGSLRLPLLALLRSTGLRHLSLQFLDGIDADVVAQLRRVFGELREVEAAEVVVEGTRRGAHSGGGEILAEAAAALRLSGARDVTLRCENTRVADADFRRIAAALCVPPSSGLRRLALEVSTSYVTIESLRWAKGHLFFDVASAFPLLEHFDISLRCNMLSHRCGVLLRAPEATATVAVAEGPDGSSPRDGASFPLLSALCAAFGGVGRDAGRLRSCFIDLRSSNAPLDEIACAAAAATLPPSLESLSLNVEGCSLTSVPVLGSLMRGYFAAGGSGGAGARDPSRLRELRVLAPGAGADDSGFRSLVNLTGFPKLACLHVVASGVGSIKGQTLRGVLAAWRDALPALEELHLDLSGCCVAAEVFADLTEFAGLQRVELRLARCSIECAQTCFVEALLAKSGLTQLSVDLGQNQLSKATMEGIQGQVREWARLRGLAGEKNIVDRTVSFVRNDHPRG